VATEATGSIELSEIDLGEFMKHKGGAQCDSFDEIYIANLFPCLI